ncbi:MAG: hypothetical protein HC821_05385 [Lewinella sp.]|nr:hypothetical protein [Lewinella sp.]
MSLDQGVYATQPKVEHRFFQENDGRFGLQITLSGPPNPSLFSGQAEERQGNVPLRYTLEADGSCAGQKLRLLISQELATSLQPLVNILRSDFDLTKRDNREFACQWVIEMALEDSENPLAYDQEALLSNLVVRNADQTLDVELVSSRFDARRHSLFLTVATRQSWPLDHIDDRQMVNFNLTAEVHLPIQRGNGRAMRPFKAILAFPRIGERQLPAPSLPLTTPESQPLPAAIGTGG